MEFSIIQGYFYTFILSVVILLVGLAIGILAKKLFQRLLQEIKLNKIIAKLRIFMDLESGLSSVIAYAIYLVSIILFLDGLGIRSVVLYIIVGALALLFLLTFIVRLKDVIPNSIGWIVIKRKKVVQKGKKIHLQQISGVIKRIGLMETEIETSKGDKLYVPNLLFVKEKMKIH